MSQAAKGQLDNKVIEELTPLREKFEAAMNDDLNTSVALSVIFELVRRANKLLEEASVTAETLNAFDVLFDRLGGDCLGIVKEEYPETGGAGDELIDKLVKLCIEHRSEARERRDFAAADTIRANLEGFGIVLEDKPDGTEWRWK
jgi:cysteinyl-tRNA synthetase